MPGKPCARCHEHEGLYHSTTYGALICQECHTTEHWRPFIVARQTGDVGADGFRVIRAGGEQYTIGPEHVNGMRGHGGRRFVFEYTGGPFKGQTLISTNVWNNGTIPVKFKDFLPDNAVIVWKPIQPLVEVKS